MILTWLFVQTQYGIVTGIVFHAAQNFFVFLNGGMLAAGIFWESWLLTFVTVVIAIILILVYGRSLQRGLTKGPAVLETR